MLVINGRKVKVEARDHLKFLKFKFQNLGDLDSCTRVSRRLIDWILTLLSQQIHSIYGFHVVYCVFLVSFCSMYA